MRCQTQREGGSCCLAHTSQQRTGSLLKPSPGRHQEEGKRGPEGPRLLPSPTEKKPCKTPHALPGEPRMSAPNWASCAALQLFQSPIQEPLKGPGFCQAM